MSGAFLKFIVLGEIPLLNMQLTFWFYFAIIIPLLGGVAMFVAIQITRRVGRKLNPFYGAPRHLTKFDLVSL